MNCSSHPYSPPSLTITGEVMGTYRVQNAGGSFHTSTIVEDTTLDRYAVYKDDSGSCQFYLKYGMSDSLKTHAAEVQSLVVQFRETEAPPAKFFEVPSACKA